MALESLFDAVMAFRAVHSGTALDYLLGASQVIGVLLLFTAYREFACGFPAVLQSAASIAYSRRNCRHSVAFPARPASIHNRFFSLCRGCPSHCQRSNRAPPVLFDHPGHCRLPDMGHTRLRTQYLLADVDDRCQWQWRRRGSYGGYQPGRPDGCSVRLGAVRRSGAVPQPRPRGRAGHRCLAVSLSRVSRMPRSRISTWTASMTP